MKNKVLVYAVMAAVAVIMPACKRSGDLSSDRRQEEQRAAVVANLILPAASTGRPWELSSLVGNKTVLLVFFTTWCPYCNQTMPYLQSFYEKHASQNLEIVGINIGESRETAEKFQKKFGLTFPVLFALDRNAFEGNYPVRFLPTLYLINRAGTSIRKFEGFHPSILDEVGKQL